MTQQEFLSAYFSATLQRTPDAVASLFKEDGSFKDEALDTVKNWHAEHLKGVRDRDAKTFDNGYKKAQSEVAKKFEKKWKEAFEFDSDLEGDELIEAIKESANSKAGGQSSTLTDEDVKKHPAFVTREKELLKKLKDIEETGKAEVVKLQKDYSRKEALSVVHKNAVSLFKSKNPILSQDEAKANRAITRLLLDPISGYDYEINEKEEIVSISKDGKRLEDASGNPVSFESLIIQTAEEGFEFKKVESKQSPGGGQGQGGQGQKAVVIPKTKEEYASMISDPAVPLADRQAIKEAWTAAQAKS